MSSFESSEIGATEEVFLEARRRILYKYARPYMDTEPARKDELRERVVEVVTEDLSRKEQERLNKDLEREREMVNEMVGEIEEFTK